MHHFIYPSQDTFVTETPEFQDLNFGLDEILRVGTQLAITSYQYPITLSTEWSQTSCSLWDTWDTPWNTFFTSSFGNAISTSVYPNRALVQFDITSISKSIASGDIETPEFRLKLKVARESELPIRYSIYAFPISESWDMGNGYVSDNGSTQGASWIYRDYQYGTPWAIQGVSYVQPISATQSFNYQVGDIDMDVTNIAMSWISGTVENNGILLISSDEFALTSSGMGLFFFSEDTNTIYEPRLDVSWNDFSWTTGSFATSSITTGSIPPGLLGAVISSASISGSLYGGFTGIGNIAVDYLITDTSSFSGSYSASGLISAYGVNGLILSMSIVGDFIGYVSNSINWVIVSCSQCTPQFSAGFNYPGGGQDQTQYGGGDIYGWGDPFNEFNQYDWTSDHVYQQEFGPGYSGSNCGPYQATMSYVMGTFIDGNFSGSTFTSSLINGYILGYGNLQGGWNENMIVGSSISSSYPFIPQYPIAVNVYFSGPYVNGAAFGTLSGLTQSYNSGYTDSGVFDGIFIAGQFAGNQIHVPFSGSCLTASYYYTSSVSFTSSSLNPLNYAKPFAAVVQDIPSTVKAGDLMKIRIFGRPQFPIKNFDRQTQFTQFLTPQYLPTSSYYAIKDNETEEIILDFDQYTQISCDENGNYFILNTTSFPQERYFKILVRVEGSSSIYNFDQGNIFKIVR